VNDLHAISIAIQAIVISQCTELHVDSLISKEWNPNPTVVAAAIKSIRVIEPSDDWLDSQDDVEQPLPTAVSGSILPQSAFYEKKKAKKNYLTSISNAATFLTFQNIYHTKIDIRSVGASHGAIYRTKLTKWLRLTPLDYDRNIFHMEIDIKGTGLKYDMGEALAVYGLNPTQQVANFLDFYNLQSNDIICIGQTHSGEYSVRTIFQLFQQYLDIFGRPSKKFYQALAGFAKNPQEKEKLEYIISDKGQEEFKIRVKETITFEDLLREFPSAKPTVEELIELIPPIKPRHYSIASSMKMHPDSVHLLVVTDDWTTPSGKYRVGQCSGYLAGLTNPETEDIYLTVSVAPSLMKLPPKNSQPVVMAGLGTGMAPFRAFIQERQYLLQQGEKVGPMALYFGSRFRAQEYLYGEELEAYHASGLLTYLRLAFSRDQKDKVYIQHKLGSDKSEICSLLLENKGHFYLCGPTWPAGDVYDAIVANFMAGGMTKKEAQETVYKMKEEGRYVLEVY
jgi:sulfite reductase (NADPH) flavoprotein alpha-component